MTWAPPRLPHPVWMTKPPWNLILPLMAPGDIRATPAQYDTFRSFAQLGDPLADGVVALMRRLPGSEGRRLFDQAVDRGIDSLTDPPPELVALFAQVDAVPYWLDYDLLERGSRVNVRTGLLGLAMVLPYVSLYGGYLASRPDKTLVRTGDLATMAPRRLAETASWWVEVTDPGGLHRHAAGFRSTLRVRIMHAQVRAAMHTRSDWNHQDWDTPVNQVQLAGTLLLFSQVMLLSSRALGLQFSAADTTAHLHLWRYVGHLMGVHHDLIPVTESDAWRMLWLQSASEYMPDHDSRELAEALTAAAAPLLLPPRLKNSPLAAQALTTYLTSYSRIVLGKRNADLLGAADSKPFQAAVLAVASATLVLETARRLIPGATDLTYRIGRRQRTRLIRRMLTEQHATSSYDRHDTLALP